MDTLLAALRAAVKNGFRTSEFALALMSLVLPYLFALVDPVVMAWGTRTGWIGGLVVAIYIAGRSYVKGKTASEASAHVGTVLGEAPAPTGGNTYSRGDGL